jgi:hypothetical protein
MAAEMPTVRPDIVIIVSTFVIWNPTQNKQKQNKTHARQENTMCSVATDWTSSSLGTHFFYYLVTNTKQAKAKRNMYTKKIQSVE